MKKNISILVCVILALTLVYISSSAAESTGEKAKGFWQRLFNYPANVTKESVSVVAETGKSGTGIVTDEVKRVGRVTSGEVQEAKDLVTEPITGTGETAYNAIKDTANVPVEAAKEESTQ